MDNQRASDIATGGVDSRALFNLILELNISRRNSRSYPEGHQVIDLALGKVLNSYEGLLRAGREIVIGVACDALLLGDLPLEKTNLIYRDFARVLFERGIGALVLREGLTLAELRSFIAILGARREDVYGAGGIAEVWERAGIRAIGIREIRYDLFTATEGARVGRCAPKGAGTGLWESFARGLVGGFLAPEVLDESLLDPELLAEALNRQFAALEGAGSPQARQEFDQVISDSDLRQVWDPDGDQAQVAYGKLASFVGNLSPGLRRQFLNSTFDINKIRGESTLEGFVRRLPAEVVIEALQDISQDQISVPPFVLGLLQQMSRHGSAAQGAGAVELSGQDLQEKLRTIFREHAGEEFIPESYQHKLNKMMSAEKIPLLGLEGVHDLMDTLGPASMEGKTSDILLLLLGLGGLTGEEYASLARNLGETCTFFLQTGAYGQLLKVLRQAGAESLPAETRQELQGYFVRREFLEELLDGLQVWGKGKFSEVADLIWEIGTPCIEVLLDRLALAESMSLRRYLMDRLVEFGAVAGPAIVARLGDERWYFLRNLIGVIRSSELSLAVERLRPLARHADPRVSQDALRALLQFQDPETQLRIIQDLRGKSHEVQLAAVRIAGKSSSPEISGILHAMVAAPGLSGKEYELKSAVLQALAEIGDHASLPVLEAVLVSRNLWHPRLLNRIKCDLVATLARYPAAAVYPVLARLAKGRGPLARQAGLQLRNIAVRPS
jgi:hypothetical protein